MPNLTRILVPTEFSPCSQRAFDYALFLAGRVGASVELVYVWEPNRYVGPDTRVLLPGEQAFALGEFVEAKAKEEMEEFIAPYRSGGLRVTGRVISGSPAEAILRVATDEKFDLIVMGTHGLSGLKHLLLGSVAEQVIRAAPCPVVTVRG